jgi:hypothetical protein
MSSAGLPCLLTLARLFLLGATQLASELEFP